MAIKHTVYYQDGPAIKRAHCIGQYLISSFFHVQNIKKPLQSGAVGIVDISDHLLVPNRLRATHAVTTVQTFIAGTATNGDMSAGITGRRIALHVFGSGVYGTHPVVFIHSSCSSPL